MLPLCVKYRIHRGTMRSVGPRQQGVTELDAMSLAPTMPNPPLANLPHPPARLPCRPGRVSETTKAIRDMPAPLIVASLTRRPLSVALCVCMS